MFQKARLKLTAWYLFIIMLVSASFSLFIYEMITRELDRFSHAQRYRIERRFRDGELFEPPSYPIIDQELIEETKYRLTLVLVVINGGILFVSGGLGYLLAGRTLRPIQDMLDEQNQFISDASHELRTPLTSLKSSLEVYLRDPHLTIRLARLVMKESIEEVNKLQSLSDGLLQLAQYQKPNGHVAFTSMRLNELITKAVRKVEPMAKKKQITIDQSMRAIELFGDPDSLSDLFVILLDNAVKYSEKGKHIMISADRDDKSVAIAVSDEGIGIDPKDIPHIFDRFYRADEARSKTETGGYGLGLSIAKKIVSLHNGSISVTSSQHKGSRFIVRLPIIKTLDE